MFTFLHEVNVFNMLRRESTFFSRYVLEMGCAFHTFSSTQIHLIQVLTSHSWWVATIMGSTGLYSSSSIHSSTTSNLACDLIPPLQLLLAWCPRFPCYQSQWSLSSALCNHQHRGPLLSSWNIFPRVSGQYPLIFHFPQWLLLFSLLCHLLLTAF